MDKVSKMIDWGSAEQEKVKFDGEQFQDTIDSMAELRRLVHKHFSDGLQTRLHGTKFDDEALISILADLQSDSFFSLSKVGLATSVGELLNASRSFAAMPMQRLEFTSTIPNVDLGPTLIGRGWHSPEPEPFGQFRRWSGPALLSTIFIQALKPGPYLISGRIRFLLRKDDHQFLAKLGNQFCSVELTENEDGTLNMTFQDEIQGIANSNFHVLEFFNNTVARPADVEPGNGDTRKLGFCLYSLSVKPISK